MPNSTVVFDDAFFESLSDQTAEDRDGFGRPSRSDILAYVVMPLMELLSDDYDGCTIPVPGDDLFRVLIQPATLVERISLYTYELDGAVHVCDVEIEHYAVEPPDDVDE